MSLHLDGLLSSQEARELQEHIQACDECHRQWEALCWASSVLEAEPAVAPAPGFAERVTGRIQKQEALLRQRSIARVILGSVGLWLVLGLTLLLTLVLIWRPSPHMLLIDVMLPVGRSVLSTTAVLSRAISSVLHVLAAQTFSPVALGYASVGFLLAIVWARALFQWWARPGLARDSAE